MAFFAEDGAHNHHNPCEAFTADFQIEAEVLPLNLGVEEIERTKLQAKVEPEVRPGSSGLCLACPEMLASESTLDITSEILWVAVVMMWWWSFVKSQRWAQLKSTVQNAWQVKPSCDADPKERGDE